MHRRVLGIFLLILLGAGKDLTEAEKKFLWRLDDLLSGIGQRDKLTERTLSDGDVSYELDLPDLYLSFVGSNRKVKSAGAMLTVGEHELVVKNLSLLATCLHNASPELKDPPGWLADKVDRIASHPSERIIDHLGQTSFEIWMYPQGMLNVSIKKRN